MNLRCNESTHAGLPDPDAEASEFETFALTQSPADIQAAIWTLRKRSGLDAADAADAAALADWLATEPRHARALDDLAHTIDELQQLPASELAALRHRLSADESVTASPTRKPAPPSRARWWHALRQDYLPQAALASTIFALCGATWLGWLSWQQRPVFEHAYTTGQGQQLSLVLPDAPSQGSTLQLDAASQVAVSLYRDRREVRLQEGQAMFAVHPDAQRPFHIWAGKVRITVMGTRFSVRHSLSGRDAGHTVVEVEEGRVRVAPASAGVQRAQELVAGQRLIADGQGRLGAVTRMQTIAVAPWRSGRVSFDQTPLAEAIAEFERYGYTGLIVRDPVVAALPVGGSYSLGQHQQFARALPELLPVRLQQNGEFTEVIAQTK